MRIAKGWLTAGVLSLSGVICLLFGSCDDEPTRSRPPKPEEPKDYPVYFCNGANSTLWTFHPTTQLLDSVAVPYEGEMLSVEVSSDGQLLYFVQEDRVLVVTADSLSLVRELPCDAWFGATISPDDNLLAIMGQEFYILRTSDWGVVYFDSTRIENGVFSSDSRTFYGCRIDSGDLCWVKPLEQIPTLSHKAFLSTVSRIEPTPDGTKLLLCLRWHFVAYDISADSILCDIGIYPGPMHPAVTPDGNYGLFTNPSTALGDPGTPDIYVFDVEANRLIDTIEIQPFWDSIGGSHWVGIGEIAITPDGRWLAAFDGSPIPHAIIGVNLQLRKPYYFHEFGANHWFGSIAVQHDR